MDVYWMEQTLADLPVADDWLSANEITRLQSMQVPKRRSDWRLGRWVGKLAVASFFGLTVEPPPLTSIEIRPRPSGAPDVFINNQRASVSISLSHRDGTAICALAESSVALGCDLETIEPHSAAFVADYFTAREQAILSETVERDLYSSLLWSAKESALKALGTGLRADTRCVEVQCEHPPFRQQAWGWLQVRHVASGLLKGWWQQNGIWITTLVADSTPCLPIALQRPSHGPDALSVKTVLCEHLD
jgi:4'-phosphopantetheinyl transferase